MCRLEAMADESASVEVAPAKAAKTATFAASQPTESNKPEKTSKTDEILRHTQLTLDPPGVRMSEGRKVEPVEIGDISAITLAPAGSDMGELNRNLEEVHPDISHLSLLEKE